MRILFAEGNTWRDDLELAAHKYARFFLQEGHNVAWIARFLHTMRLLNPRQEDKRFFARYAQGWTRHRDGVEEYTPFALVPYTSRVPLLDNVWVGQRFLQTTVPSLKTILRRAGWERTDVLWITNPNLAGLARIIPHRVLVYRMGDDVSKFHLVPRSLTALEAWLCQQATVVFATAEQLVRKAEQHARRVVFLPNGADVETFRGAQAVPEDMQSIPEPRLLYVGSVAEWLDCTLLEQVARALPHTSLVIIGPVHPTVQQAIGALSQLPNVYVLGQRPYLQVPGYMHGAAVGLIPFIPNDLTHAVSPIKLFEYMAAGVPVVSARLQATERLDTPAMLYETAEQAIRYIGDILAQRGPNLAELQRVAETNSWAARFAIVRSTLEQALQS